MRRFLISALLMLCALCACSVPERPGEKPVSPLPELSVEELLEGQRRCERLVSSLRGLSRATLREDGRSPGKSSQALLVQWPASARVEILGLMGQPALVTASDGLGLFAMDISHRAFYEGKASAENLDRLVRLHLEPAELVRLILMRPVLPNASRLKVRALIDGYLASGVTQNGETVYLRFDSRCHLIKITYFEHGKTRLDVEYGAFRDFVLGGETVAFPTRWQVAFPARKTSVTLQMDKPELNAPLAERLFHLEAPQGFRREAL